MILKGIKDQTVELRVIKDKTFTDKMSDSDWLRIYTNVHSNLGNWQTIDESLTFSEFINLIEWFRDLSINKKVEDTELYFTEPNLEFDLVQSNERSKQIKIVFFAESKPKSAKDGQEYFVEFNLSNTELAKIANDLEMELK